MMDTLRRQRLTAAGSGGFTLIELMVTVVIATILIGIAVPTYQTEIRKSRRTEAKNTLLDAAAREERYYATQNQYTSDTGALQYTSGSGTFPYVTGTYYEIAAITVTQPQASSTGVTTGGFQIKVVPVPGGAQTADTFCQAFLVDQTGRTTATDGSGNDTTATCWP